MNPDKESYTKSMLFEVRITSRYLSIMGDYAFEKLKLNINFEDYLILDIISYNEGICQRDLAKMLLRDRSNVGKISSNLEKEKLITIKPDLRNNRAVKRMYITKKGQKLCDDIYEILKPFIKICNDKVTEREQNIISQGLNKFRQVVNEIVETQI